MSAAPDFADRFRISTAKGTLYGRQQLQSYLVAGLRRRYLSMFSLEHRRTIARRFMACPRLHGCRGMTPGGVLHTMDAWMITTDAADVVSVWDELNTKDAS